MYIGEKMASDKERIAILINTLIIGGAERTVSNLSLYLAGKYDIDIIVNDDLRQDFPYGGNLVSLNVPPSLQCFGFIYPLYALLRRGQVLKKRGKERQYAAVLSFSEMTSLTNVLCRDGRSKRIISIRNSIRKSAERSLIYKLYAKTILGYCIRHADKTVSCSREIEKELMAGYGLAPDRSRVIYNGLDLERIRALSKEPPAEFANVLSGGEHLIVSVGRLTHQKGHRHLIRAVKKLRDDGMRIRLMILGEGDLRSDLEKLIRALGLEETVLLPGFVKNPFPYVARADAVVFPSLYEGFSNAIAEALACGAPCISSDHVSGAREILAPESDFSRKVVDRIDHARYGILVPVCDGAFREPGADLSKEELLMAEAVRELVSDPDLAAGYRTASVQRAAELGAGRICRQWADLIDEVR